MLVGCTTGKLYYQDEMGNRKLGCNVEFVGMPSVDKYAVEYALSHCAKSAVDKGYSIAPEQTYLLTLDTIIVTAPCGKAWDHDLAETQYDQGELSAKQYGYIVAHIDLGLAEVNECLSDNSPQ